MIEKVLKNLDLQNLVSFWEKDPGLVVVSALALFLAGGFLALMVPASFRGLAKLATPKPLGDTAKKIIGMFNSTCLSGTNSYVSVGMGPITKELANVEFRVGKCSIKKVGSGSQEVSFDTHNHKLKVGGHDVTETFSRRELKAIRSAASELARRVRNLQARRDEIDRESALRLLTA